MPGGYGIREAKANAETRQRVEVLETLVAELAERISALEARPEKRGPGRPRKIREDDET